MYPKVINTYKKEKKIEKINSIKFLNKKIRK